MSIVFVVATKSIGSAVTVVSLYFSANAFSAACLSSGELATISLVATILPSLFLAFNSCVAPSTTLIKSSPPNSLFTALSKLPWLIVLPPPKVSAPVSYTQLTLPTNREV